MMKRYFGILILLIAAFTLWGQGNYYDAVINLSGDALLQGLRALISTNTYSNYSGAKVYLYQTLDNTNGYVTCIYTGHQYNVGYNYTGSTNPNTEHTYAQSWFSSPQSSVKKADLHHLFPSNATVNSSRGNYPLYTVANHSSANVYYPDTPWQSYRGQSQTGYSVFEPADQSKGNIARALLYFYVRYNDTLTQQNVNMLPVLLDWNNQDPPDAAEITRNQGVYNFQNNRNPFIDHPEFVNRIWNPVDVDDSTLPTLDSLRLTSICPNPFEFSTTLNVDSKQRDQATISFYDIKGRKVAAKTMLLEPGANQITWDGCDENGARMPLGIYLVKISAGKQQINAKLILR